MDGRWKSNKAHFVYKMKAKFYNHRHVSRKKKDVGAGVVGRARKLWKVKSGKINSMNNPHLKLAPCGIIPCFVTKTQVLFI